MFNIDWYVRINVLIGVLVFCAQFFFTGLDNLSLIDVLRKAFTTTTIVFIFHCCLEKYLWKLKWLRPAIVKVPNLHGTWKGKLLSSWVDINTGKELDPIEVVVYIRQSFSSVSIEVHTDKMISTSYVAGFRTSDSGLQELCYTYSSKAHLPTRDTNPWHDGTTKLTIYEGEEILLKGEYWTARKTVGTLNIKRISNSVKCIMPISDASVTQPV